MSYKKYLKITARKFKTNFNITFTVFIFIAIYYCSMWHVCNNLSTEQHCYSYINVNVESDI